MKTRRRILRESGLSLVEILVTITVFGVAAGFVFPALQQMIHKGKIQGVARNSILIMREARLEASKRGVPCVVRIDTADGAFVSYADVNRDGVLNPDPAATDFRSTDYMLGRLPLPTGVEFDAPPSQLNVQGFTAIGGLPENAAVFQEDGSVDETGAFRIGDERGNFLEVRVAPAATAKVNIRKWDGTDWRRQGEEGEVWVWQ